MKLGTSAATMRTRHVTRTMMTTLLTDLAVGRSSESFQSMLLNGCFSAGAFSLSRTNKVRETCYVVCLWKVIVALLKIDYAKYEILDFFRVTG